jgi:U3 small nucleolar RNA-associated protein 4
MGHKPVDAKGMCFFCVCHRTLHSHLFVYQRTVDSYGGPVWCIIGDPTSKELAAACEDGCIRMFTVEDDSLHYLKAFAKQKSRILSLAWHNSPAGSVAPQHSLYSGSGDGTLRAWDRNSGTALQRRRHNKINSLLTLIS